MSGPKHSSSFRWPIWNETNPFRPVTRHVPGPNQLESLGGLHVPNSLHIHEVGNQLLALRFSFEVTDFLVGLDLP